MIPVILVEASRQPNVGERIRCEIQDSGKEADWIRENVPAGEEQAPVPQQEEMRE